MLTVDSMCRWYSAQTEQEWVRAGLSAAVRSACRAHMQGEHGDRRQELVFIGLSGMVEADVTKELDACLVTDEQMASGVGGWKEMVDPWQDWSISAVESTMMAQTREVIADREKYKLDLWLEREAQDVSSGNYAAAIDATSIRSMFEKLRALGESKAEEGEFAAALTVWDEALLLKGLEGAVDPHAIACVNEYEAQLLMEAGDYFGAIHTCDRALEVCPELAVAQHTKARAQLEMGEIDMAGAGLGSLLELVATSPADASKGGLDVEAVHEDLARCVALKEQARKLEAETGGQVLRGELVLPGQQWNKSCYGSRHGKPGDMNCDTRNRLYLNLLMAKALDVGSAAAPEDYVSDNTSSVYGLLPVRLGCPTSRPMIRELQCCAVLEPLNKLLASQKAAKASSLRFPTSLCAPGESPEEAAARAYSVHYSDALGSSDELRRLPFIPPVVHYHLLPNGATEVQTFFVAVCPPAVTAADVQEEVAQLRELAKLALTSPAVCAAELKALQERLRWTTVQAAWGLLCQIANDAVQQKLKPADDGWYEPNSVIAVTESLFEETYVLSLFRELLATGEEVSDAKGQWEFGVLIAIELLCVSWNIPASLPSLLDSVCFKHSLVASSTLLQWHSSDPRQLLLSLGDRSSEKARSEVLLGSHKVRSHDLTTELINRVRSEEPQLAATHDSEQKDTSAGSLCHWSVCTERDNGVLAGAAATIASKARANLLEATAAGLMTRVSADWDQLKTDGGSVTGKTEPLATERGTKRKQQEPIAQARGQADFDLLIVGAGASGVGCAVQAKLFGIEPSRTLILERGHCVGSSFNSWPAEMRFITPSFNQQAYGFMDLNSVAYDTSPAQLLHEQHPTGSQYAAYLAEVARLHKLPIAFCTDVTSICRTGHDDDGFLPSSISLDGLGVGRRSSGGFEVTLKQGAGATNKLPATVRTHFIIWAAGEFQYPRTDGFPGADLCLHNSAIQSWAHERDLSPGTEKERVVIGGYESGMDAAVNLAALGVRVTVVASSPFWTMRTLDPSTELAPYTAGRLKAALKSPCPPTLLGHCRVQRVERTQDGEGFVVTVEKHAPTSDSEQVDATALVRVSADDKTAAGAGHAHGHGHGQASVQAQAVADDSGHGRECDHAHGADRTCHHGHGHGHDRGHGHGHGTSSGESNASTGPDKGTTELTPAAETMILQTVVILKLPS
eukprot:COSAG01_NODE_1857_length_9044_cov_24.006931_4_plen_1191_part_00